MALATRKKPAVHQRKRQAQHHRKSKPYMKAYWPYLPMLLVIGVGFMVNSVWSHSSVLGAQQDFSAVSLLNATNTERQAHDEIALTIDTQLSNAAQAKATDMAQSDYWAHNSPDGKTPWTFITASGYQYQAAGENLAYGFDNADTTVAGWMSSAEHRANILAANYQNVGFGVAQTENYQGHGPETIIVAEYGQPTATIGIGATVPEHSTPAAEISSRPVSRIQLLSGERATWSLMAVIALTGGAFAILFIRHSLRFQRAFVSSERFIAHHPLLDIAFTVVVTGGVLLTRSTGVIR